MATTGGAGFDFSCRHLRIFAAWKALQTFRPLAISNDPQAQARGIQSQPNNEASEFQRSANRTIARKPAAGILHHIRFERNAPDSPCHRDRCRLGKWDRAALV